MTDLFRDKASDWDARPTPTQISEGVFEALKVRVSLAPEMSVLDFGAGTGLLIEKIAPFVGRLLAVDVSQAMLEKLLTKPALAGKVEVFCQDILERPLGQHADLAVSAMAMHHVKDTHALATALFDHLKPGGRIALADLDTEDGSFHPAQVEGVFHQGFDRSSLGRILSDAGFADVDFGTACVVEKEDRRYPVFLVTATKPAS
mgnify:CR=1 FL=1